VKYAASAAMTAATYTEPFDFIAERGLRAAD